jgi:tRNA (guanine37-N1)-methyltransferase
MDYLKGNLKKLLEEKLEFNELKRLYRSYDIIGDIAIIRVPDFLDKKSELIANAIIDTHNGVKSVWKQVGSVTGDYRIRDLEYIIGEKKSETIYKEHGCIYKTDIRETYFSPRLSYERLRIAKLVHPGETVLNMFAGVGCYSIAIANHSKPLKVYSIDINPIAIKYLQENIRLNRREKTVIPLLGDAKNLIEQKLQSVSDRVIMPLPEKAFDYLNSAISSLKPKGGWINYYDFEHAKKNEDPIEKTINKVSKKIKLITDFEVKFGRIVRPIGPGWYQIVLDINIKG